jgi:predicted Fe-Mo cluster-binding NifX family protein
MKVAIPIFGPRVSPRFDYAPGLLLFNLEDGKVVGSEKFSLQAWDRLQRLQKLQEFGVKTLICGGIDGNSVQILSDYGIRVISWVVGEADEAMQFFLEGKLRPGVELCPRCRRRQRRERRFRWG